MSDTRTTVGVPEVEDRALREASGAAGGRQRQNFMPNTAVCPFPFCTRQCFSTNVGFSKATVKRRRPIRAIGTSELQCKRDKKAAKLHRSRVLP
ncbi:hypothetical protein EGR_06880 [Echinococcus granulosus]|uniref:Uncharacterized protein n=1 Tax=Echinococcus granulosus TaxID=6210 RepID=W6UAY1_ECHGR|nr:hypothetical protein EGR_06880 [Echinococcus granulosus]EUB58245.1 hypothetical protein EGR_06880 [Echinococcus granulosus]